MPKKRYFYFFFIIIVIAFFAKFSLAENPGISIIFDNALRGGYAQQEFSIPLEGRTFNNVLISGAIKDWLKTENVAVENDILKFNLIAQPPTDAMLGRHEGFVVINTISLPGGISSTVSASTAIKVVVEMSAIETKQIAVTTIDASDSEQGSSIEIKARIANTGNIIAKPTVSISILDSSRKEIRQISSTLETLPTVEDDYSVFVRSDGLVVAQYFAKVTVLLDGVFVKEITLPFEIRQTSSLAKKGELIKLAASQAVLVNTTVQLNAEFNNTGQLPVSARIAGEIWFADALLGTIEGIAADVGIGEQKTITAEFIPREIGLYKITAHANYDGRQTNAGEIFVDSRSSLSETMPLSLNAAVIIFWLVLVIVIAVMISRRRKKKKSGLEHRCSRRVSWD
jgi:hypothetical protein